MSAERTSTPQLRIPEPHEVMAWVRQQWLALNAYLAVAENQALVGVLAVAALLRLTFLDLMPIRDETITLLARLGKGTGGLLDFGDLAQGGPEMSLLLALYRVLIVVTRDPRWLAAAQSLATVAALALFYHLVRRRLGTRPAVYSLAVLAVNPWAVLSSRTLTAEAWFIPLAALILFGLDLALERRRIEGWLLLSLCLPTLIYFRLGNVTLLLVVGALVLLYRRRVAWVHILFASLLGALYLLPGVYVANLVGFGAARVWLKAWSRTLIEPSAYLETLQRMQALLAGHELSSLAAPEALDWRWLERFLGLNSILGWLAVVALPVAAWIALRAWGRWREGDRGTLTAVACVWLVVGLATAWRGAPGPLYASPLMTMLPAAAIAMGIAIDRLVEFPSAPRFEAYWWSQPARLAIIIVLCGAGLWHAYQTLHLNGHVGQADVSQGYGVPYRYWRRTANLVAREAEAESLDQVWLLGGGGSGMLGRAPEMMDYVLGGEVDVVICGSPSTQGALLPAGLPGLYLTTGDAPMAERAIAMLGAEDRGLVLYPDGDSEARIQFLDERPIADMIAPIGSRGLWVFDSGCKLLGCDWPSIVTPGQTLQVANYWTFGDIPPEDREMEHVVFCRLLDARGGVVTETNGMALPESAWASGLMLKQWWRLDMPDVGLPDAFYLQVGMFRPEDGHRAAHIDEQGYTVNEAVLIGPLRGSD